MKLKILGSVSPYCNKESNCPGYLIEDDNEKILLDCGNGICRNLIFPDDLNNLNIIISHLHKDHYGDLLSIGYASYVYHNLGLLNEKVNVYIPKTTSNKKQYIDYQYLLEFEEKYFNIIEYDELSYLNIGNLNISFSKTSHAIDCYAVKILSNNSSIVYTGDAGYKGIDKLIYFTKNSDILICESSFLKEQSVNNENHLCAYEAALLAQKANVKKLILTHFWPEINKQDYLNEAKEIFDNTFVAVENDVYEVN